MQESLVKRLARECGFELAGIAPAEPLRDDYQRFQEWLQEGYAGEMRYLTDRRSALRLDPRNLLSTARSMICVGKRYNQPAEKVPEGRAVISRYAVSRDYHDVLREGLENLAGRISALESHQWKACVDTAPLLERSYARRAGLGWIGRNTCLINEPQGSWFFLGVLLTTLQLEADHAPADRCGTCMRCIEACPTQALVPAADGEWTLDARRCISYLTIELRGPIPQELHAPMGTHVFGCDICQEVCPWNSRAEETTDPAFAARMDAAPPLDDLTQLTKEEFLQRYAGTPVLRPKYEGFMRNVAIAEANGKVKTCSG